METSQDPLLDENRRIRLLRICTDMLVQIILTRPVSLSEAQEMIEGIKEFALDLFPDKNAEFDLIYLPRFRRALREAGLVSRSTLRVVNSTPTEGTGV
jgi:hypothetical protein